ncbi:MAG: aminotransferase class V-fold PLP-dependent enzyme [Anaerolineae bacterium]|nr:aminotransferase class V-fold PLP-dependent enzyme [Anaerolineae bacterium]
MDTFTPPLRALREEMASVIAVCTFLNHAATSPLPRRVRDAMVRHLDRCQITFGLIDQEERDIPARLRHAVARLINATSDEIAIIQNTSHGLNLVAQSLPFRPGDNIIFCDMEFPSNVYPWMLLERQKGVEARCIPHDRGGLTVEALEAHADSRTRAVAVSSVEFLTGFRTDLAAIGEWCRAHGAYFIVDGIQSLGVIPMDVRALGIDFLACGGPKWLMGPVGVGFLYCRRELLEEMSPPMAGCLSVVGWEDWRDYNLTFLPDARRFDLGGPNLVGMAGLAEAIELLLEAGIENIQRHTFHLTDVLIADLQQRGYPIASNLHPVHRSPIVAFSVPGDVRAAYARLRAAKIAVSLRESYIRVSPHGYNTEEEVLRVGEVLGQA